VNDIDLNSDDTGNDLVLAYDLAPEGLVMEFGVFSGSSITQLAKRNTSRTVYGFDSFEGLPEHWMSGYDAGHFACELPKVPENVVLVKGWFNETLPLFLEQNKEQVAFIHIDCDLYSSTKTIFDNVKNRLAQNCIFVFDELVNYGNNLWREHEYKAFQEFLEETKYKYQCVGKWGHHQAAFKIYK